MAKFCKIAFLVCALLIVSGCATTTERTRDPSDPFEPINRVTYAFNNKFDNYILKPTAYAYKYVIPWPAREGVSNFFVNLGEVTTTVNDGLQGQVHYALQDLSRFLINSTLGIGGLIDVASHMGIEKRYNDFGITLAKWGVTNAPYIMVPILGPTTIRDGIGTLVDYRFFSLWRYIEPIRLRNSLFALDIVNFRSTLLDSESALRHAALDPYVLLRTAYLQKRASLIKGSNGEEVAHKKTAEELAEEDFALEDSAEEIATDNETDTEEDAQPSEERMQEIIDEWDEIEAYLQSTPMYSLRHTI